MTRPPEVDMLLDAPDLWSLLEQRRLRSPGSTMLIEAGSAQSLSFGQVHALALQRAAWLQAQGVGPDAVVAWQLPTRIDTVLSCLALVRLGVLQVPVIHLYRERELAEVLLQSRPTHVLTPGAEAGGDYAARLAAAMQATGHAAHHLVLPAALPQTAASLPPLRADGSAVRWHYYTSGTTSRPKAALHTDSSLIAAGRGMAGRLGMTADDVGSVAYPFGHVGGVLYLAAVMATGMPVLLLERFVAAEAAAAYRRHGVTFGGGSTAHYQALLAEQRRAPSVPLLPALKVLAGGGAIKPAALYHEVKRELGCTIVHAYGLTEAPISSSNAPGDSDEQLAHSDGAPQPGVELRIRRDDGSAAAAGESGEILLRGPNLCRGYLDAEQTRAAFDSDGFFRTGDIGLIRPDGLVAITGRIKDLIIRKGENISAREIEELLLAHPKVRDVAVIGLPDTERGERVCAVVELADRADPLGFAEMRSFLEGHKLMRQKIPEQLETVDALPRNEGLQKVIKYRLREALIARGAAAEAGA